MVSSNKSIILLTGATGFLGSHLLRGLLSNGYSVVILKRSRSDTWRINDLLDKCVVYDLDTISLRDVFKNNNIKAVIHTATCYGRKGETVTQIVGANLMLPLSILELSDEFDVDVFFNTDTFFNVDTVLPGGLNTYVLSKKHFLDYGCQIARTSNVQFTNIRLEHLYGPGDDSSKFIPSIIRVFLNNEVSLDLTAGEQERDFIYVDDVIAAYLMLLEHEPELTRPVAYFELGGGRAIALADLVKLARRVSKSHTKLNFGSLPYRQDEIMHSEANIDNLKNIGWEVNTSLEDGLAKVISYEKERLVNKFE